MKKLFTSLVLLLLVIFQNSFSQSFQSGMNLQGQEVKPRVVNVSELPQSVMLLEQNYTQERGKLPADRNTGDMKSLIRAQEDKATNGPSLSIKGYAGPNKNGWQPADADIATGMLHVMVVTNEQFHIYGRNNSLPLITSNTLQSFFGRPGKNVFDPKVVYDPWRNRWVMLAFERDGLFAYYWLAVSQTSDPTGSWWTYQFNAHIDASTTTTNWADYPGLGITSYDSPSDSTSIIITSNQYNQADAFQYAKIRVLKAKQVYAGQSAGYWDFWNMTDANAGKSFTVKPAVQWWTTAYGTAYLANTYGGSNNYYTIWRIDKPLWWSATGGITLTRQSTITVNAYSVPTSVKQPGSVIVDAGDCRTQDIILTKGTNSSNVAKLFMYTAVPSKYAWTVNDTNSVISYCKLNVTDNTVDAQQLFGSTGLWFTYPKVAPKYKTPYNSDTVFISYISGGASVYNESRVIAHDRATGIGPSYLIQAGGTAHYGSFRFGDYSGACIDPLQNGNVWVVSMRNNNSNWGTGIGYVSTTAISGISQENEFIPSKYTLSQNYPNPFNPTTIISFGLPKSENVSLRIYNSLGKEVATLMNTNLEAGNYKVDFDATNLTSGIYFYKLTAGSNTLSKKMLLIK
ncbi:MAG: T9SS type A sorting domain-containing protein [Ignavibacteriota bacterium]